jgi:hypothetical protein
MAKIDKIRPEITMVEMSALLESKLPEKVKEASLNYFSRSMEAIEEPFARDQGRWRAASALAHWSKKFGLKDYENARKALEEHKPNQAVEKMCRLITGKSIFDLFTEYGLNTRTVECKCFDEMIVKMPYAYALVTAYEEDEVIKHIADTMGWAVVDPALETVD